MHTNTRTVPDGWHLNFIAHSTYSTSHTTNQPNKQTYLCIASFCKDIHAKCHYAEHISDIYTFRDIHFEMPKFLVH